LIFNYPEIARNGQKHFFDRLAMFIENREGEKATICKTFLEKMGAIWTVTGLARTPHPLILAGRGCRREPEDALHRLPWPGASWGEGEV